MTNKTLTFGIIALTLLATVGTVMAVGNGWTGYNYGAGIFVGTGVQYCTQKYSNPTDQASCLAYLGIYQNDKVTMKWNAEWDRGNTEGWSSPPYAAYLDNEWNGRFPGGSGQVWHYKFKWVGLPCDNTNPLWAPGGYCIWGQFEVLMDQGIDPNIGPGHIFYALAKPNGYGASLP